jgi:hypothetical protein
MFTEVMMISDPFGYFFDYTFWNNQINSSLHKNNESIAYLEPQIKGWSDTESSQYSLPRQIFREYHFILNSMLNDSTGVMSTLAW